MYVCMLQNVESSVCLSRCSAYNDGCVVKGSMLWQHMHVEYYDCIINTCMSMFEVHISIVLTSISSQTLLLECFLSLQYIIHVAKQATSHNTPTKAHPQPYVY